MTPSSDQLASFAAYIAGPMGISSTYLSPTDPNITLALSTSLDFVNQLINAVAPDLYTLAVNGLAGDFLLQWAQDLPGQTFFANARQNYGINSFVAGVVHSTADEQTEATLSNPEFMDGLTLMDLQNLKTPYGRQYLMIAQQFGALWGLT